MKLPFQLNDADLVEYTTNRVSGSRYGASGMDDADLVEYTSPPVTGPRDADLVEYTGPPATGPHATRIS